MVSSRSGLRLGSGQGGGCGTRPTFMHYTHICSYDHALYPYMVIWPCIIRIYGHMTLSPLPGSGQGGGSGAQVEEVSATRDQVIHKTRNRNLPASPVQHKSGRSMSRSSVTTTGFTKYDPLTHTRSPDSNPNPNPIWRQERLWQKRGSRSLMT